MPEQPPPAAPAVAGDAENDEKLPQWLQNIFDMGWRIVVMMLCYNLFIGGPARPSQQMTGIPAEIVPTGGPTPNYTISEQDKLYTNMYMIGDEIDMKVYVNENESFDINELIKEEPLWEYNFHFGNWTEGPAGDATIEKSFTLTASETVQNNGSIYSHIVFNGTRGVFYKSWRLNVYELEKKEKNLHNLLSSKSEEEKEETPKQDEAQVPVIKSHWHPNITISMVYNTDAFIPRRLPPQMAKHMVFDYNQTVYEPIVYKNTFWNMKNDHMPINSTVKELNLNIAFSPLTTLKWQFFTSVDQSFQQQNDFGAMKAGEMDMFKEMLMETSPWLLGLTMIVTMFHSVFDFLAFKNDIQFWRNRKSVMGLSVRTIFTNLFFQSVILLYLYDNDTSYMILVSSTIGLAIEFWKITKAVHVTVDFKNRILGIVPRIRFEDRATYRKSKTKEYDDLAFSYLSKLCFPLVACYSIYSLIYNPHKSWYSWVLNSLVGAIYMFGFIMMTPQLFINYKLQSVAHMPWRMMTYKALNTFIDDLFAFIIKMPWLHRLACLRDDLIFFVYIYQRYIYVVDPTRKNEYEGGDDVEDDAIEETKEKSVEKTECVDEAKKEK